MVEETGRKLPLNRNSICKKENMMVKTYHLIDYLKSGIEQNIVCNDDCKLIDYELSEEKSNSFEVEFTDYETENNDKTKFRVNVEVIE